MSARENTTEYIDDIEYPTSPIPANAAISDSEKIVNTSAKIASIICILKYAKESILESMAAPAKVPAVLQAKYTLGASPTLLTELSSDGSRPSFSIRTIGEAMFIPMSSPTTATIAKNNATIILLENKPATFLMEADPRSGGSGMSVKYSHIPKTIVTAPKIGKIHLHEPRTPAAKSAIKGPANDERAFMDCPADAALASLSGATQADKSGIIETCKITFPIPSSAKPATQNHMESKQNARAAESAVIAALRSAVLRLPILPMSIAAGIENTRNHTKTADGRNPKNSSGNEPENSAFT